VGRRHSDGLHGTREDILTSGRGRLLTLNPFTLNYQHGLMSRRSQELDAICRPLATNRLRLYRRRIFLDAVSGRKAFPCIFLWEFRPLPMASVPPFREQLPWAVERSSSGSISSARPATARPSRPEPAVLRATRSALCREICGNTFQETTSEREGRGRENEADSSRRSTAGGGPSWPESRSDSGSRLASKARPSERGDGRARSSLRCLDDRRRARVTDRKSRPRALSRSRRLRVASLIPMQSQHEASLNTGLEQRLVASSRPTSRSLTRSRGAAIST
jgi:hypothetical protein